VCNSANSGKTGNSVITILRTGRSLR
jgi:hypothetical protein